jgi:hypothetical protein
MTNKSHYDVRFFYLCGSGDPDVLDRWSEYHPDICQSLFYDDLKNETLCVACWRYP